MPDHDNLRSMLNAAAEKADLSTADGRSEFSDAMRARFQTFLANRQDLSEDNRHALMARLESALSDVLNDHAPATPTAPENTAKIANSNTQPDLPEKATSGIGKPLILVAGLSALALAAFLVLVVARPDGTTEQVTTQKEVAEATAPAAQPAQNDAPATAEQSGSRFSITAPPTGNARNEVTSVDASGTFLLTSTTRKPNPSGRTNVSYLTLDKSIVDAIKGKTAEVSMTVNAPAENGAAEMALAFAGAGAEAEFTTFKLSQTAETITLPITLSANDAPNKAYVAIWADTSGDGKAVIVGDVTITTTD